MKYLVITILAAVFPPIQSIPVPLHNTNTQPIPGLPLTGEDRRAEKEAR